MQPFHVRIHADISCGNKYVSYWIRKIICLFQWDDGYDTVERFDKRGKFIGFSNNFVNDDHVDLKCSQEQFGKVLGYIDEITKHFKAEMTLYGYFTVTRQ